MIERKIIIGLITNTEYVKKVRRVWDSMLIESITGRTLGQWAVEYFDKYQQAPQRQIETIFYAKMLEGLEKTISEEIEEDILPDLSEEYENSGGINIESLYADTVRHFNTSKLKQLGEQITNLIENGQGSMDDRLKQAEELRSNFKPITEYNDTSVDLSTPSALRAIRRAFSIASEPIVKFPKQLGEFWNAQFVPGAFISFLAPEKRGKTFLLLEIAIRSAKQGRKVAFFQAGDMNEAEQLKRIGVYLCKRSNLERYCKEHYQVVRDCRYNQDNSCTRDMRECDFSPFSDNSRKFVDEETGTSFNIGNTKKYTLQELIEAYEANLDYKPCYNCKAYQTEKMGVPWLQKVKAVQPIEYRDVEQAVVKFFHKNKRKFKLSTHANGTLSVKDVENILNDWEVNEGFIPDEIIIDYADILVPSVKVEFRHQQNQTWKELRKLSQTPRGGILPLVISPTQADAESYKKYRLELSNFSEDKRKYGHVTAIYGLNQDPQGIEKALGLLRINELILREGVFSNTNEITVIQDLGQGRPVLGSYF